MPPKPTAKGAGGSRSGAGQGSAATRPRPGAVAGVKKTAGTAQGGKGVTGGAQQAVRGPGVGRKPGIGGASKGRGSSNEKVKKSAAVSKGVGDKKEVKQKVVVWSKEDGMARRIQTYYRGYRCCKLLLELKNKRADYDQMMEKLQRDAYVQMVRLEQQRAEAERKREEEARKKRKEQARRISHMLEAGFDGDTNEIKSIMEEVRQVYKDQGEEMIARNEHKLVECSDANKNSPLSEAAAGGDPDTIRLLLALGANPNTKGQYGRTPLYRAAFAGHHLAVKVLLESGADPRLGADDGERPEQIAASQAVASVFQEWNLDDTEKLLVDLEEVHRKRKEAQNKLQETVENKLHKEVEDAEKEYSARQRELSKAHEELNKRIYEHDKNMAAGAVKAEITLAVVHDAEDQLSSIQLAADTARERLSMVKLQLRLKQREFQDEDESGNTDEDYSDVTINIRELDDVLMKDVGNKISQSGKWPLLIDPGKQAATFLRYRDTNYLNCCNPRQMEPEVIRMALLGSIKYGKFLVLDLLDVDGLWAGVQQRMDLVQKDLLKDIMDMSLIRDNKFQSLSRESDGEEYSAKSLLGARVEDFKLVVLSQLLSLPKQFTEQFYVIRIHTSEI